jgi:hypothetical protein
MLIRWEAVNRHEIAQPQHDQCLKARTKRGVAEDEYGDSDWVMVSLPYVSTTCQRSMVTIQGSMVKSKVKIAAGTRPLSNPAETKVGPRVRCGDPSSPRLR